MKKTIAFLMILALSMLCGCETTKGFGKDLQKAGDWIEHQAKK